MISKDEILELYLNRAPFGGNIRGIEAASMAYFNKNASALSLGESALLISLVKSPSLLRPDRYPQRAIASRNRLLKFLYEKKIIPRENMIFATLESIFPVRFNMPRQSAMAAAQILKNSGKEGSVKSTIDSGYQRSLQIILESSLESMPKNITAAAVVVNNTGGEILAYVGNARHGLPLPGSQVDCGNAPRSPGSTLKPFVYSKAFERGLITPGSLLADTPISFSGNAPRNFDMTHRGPVTAKTALSLSLNTPAVRVLRMLGYPQMRTLYEELGFSFIDRDSSFYADSLVLGGCEVTMLQLAAAYRSLADGGRFLPLKWIPGESEPERTVISPEAAWLTTKILQDERRLIPLYQEIFKENSQVIAFKTGTSHGFRDAWSAGFSKRLTIVVWFGAPNNAPDYNLIGLQIAAPAMLHIFREFWEADDGIETPPPAGVYTRKVCALSGLPAGRYCESTVIDYAIRDVSENSVCDLHRKIDDRVVSKLPKELEEWFQARARSNISSPGVKITRPFKNKKILTEKNVSAARIYLSAEGALPHYWYLDGRFLATDSEGRGLFFDVPTGSHRLSVLSGEDSDLIEFEVFDPENDAVANKLKILD
jgi:penicillin-binding protein 1C